MTTFKRNIDRLPIPPKDAKKFNVTCDFCIVGCGYHAYTWPVGTEGGPKPDQNALDMDYTRQQGPMSKGWYNPAMYNIVRQNGRDVHLVIKPDPDCQVNGGLNSVRGGRMGETRFSEITQSMSDRLKYPMVWRYSELMPTSWDDATDLVAQVTKAVMDKMGPNGVYVSMFDHGGAAGGYENTWGTGKLYFTSIGTEKCRIHNRPAYNSEVHATRDMGVGELNNAYEDAELADTILAFGANPLETQTNYFLNHWMPNLRGETTDKKGKIFGSGEPVGPGHVIFVDPRATTTMQAIQFAGAGERMLHLQVEAGTDLVLLNALLTYIVDQGWHAKEFIQAHTSGFEAALNANRTSLEDAERITGLKKADIIKAAEWIAKPKAGGFRPRTMVAYEKGFIWSNDNYRTNAATANLALALYSVGREGGGCVRMGGHQEGYVRPDYPGPRPAPYIDKELIEGKGGIHFNWAVDHFKSTLNAESFRKAYRRRTNLVKDALSNAPAGDRTAQVQAVLNAIENGGLFSVVVDLFPTQIGEAAHVWLPATSAGEMNLTSMNGERRLRLTEKYMDPPGDALPDCLIAARIAQALERVHRAAGNAKMADRFKGYDWKTEEDAFMDGYHQHATGGQFVTYDRLRHMGTNGVQEPVVGYDEKTGNLIGTKRLYTDGKFGTKDGRAQFMAAQWRGLPPDREADKKKFRFLINNGRTNIIWQNAFFDMRTPFVVARQPLPFLDMNPRDMQELKIEAGDLVEVYNDVGATQALAYPTPTATPGRAFMTFAQPKGQVGNIVSAYVNELRIPNYKNVWGNIRKIGHAPQSKDISFKEPGIPQA